MGETASDLLSFVRDFIPEICSYRIAKMIRAPEKPVEVTEMGKLWKEAL